jgi:hypothetical protein
VSLVAAMRVAHHGRFVRQPLVEIASAMVLTVFGLLVTLALIGAHKSAEIVALYSLLSALLIVLFLGLMACLMWITYRSVVLHRSISRSAGG